MSSQSIIPTCPKFIRADYFGKCVCISIFSETGLKPLAGPGSSVGKTNHESMGIGQYQRSFKRRGEGRRLLSLTLLFLSTEQLGLIYLDFLISQIFTKHLYLNWDKNSLEPCWWQTVGGFAGSYTVKMNSISAFAQVYIQYSVKKVYIKFCFWLS